MSATTTIQADTPRISAVDHMALARRYLDVMRIVSLPLFSHRVDLARELGLLSLLTAGQLEEVMARASELIAALGGEEPPDLPILFRQTWLPDFRYGRPAASLAEHEHMDDSS
jgi:hypothetical protein